MKKLLLILSFVLVYQANAQMVISQDATAQSCDCYTLTTETNLQRGGVFSPNTIDLNNPFDFSFEIYLGSVDNWTADGIAFVLQQGQSVGIHNPPYFGTDGLNPMVGIEIDVHQNAAAPFNDPAADHIDFFINGDVTAPVSPVVSIGNIEDGAFHTLNVAWDPVLQVMAVTLDGAFITAYNADIINTVFGGNSNVYFGFTGATGGLNNLQRVCMYRNSSFNQNTTTACVGETITFTDNSTSDLNDITTYLWDFGDGTTSNLQNPTHSWASAGAKVITLTITDITGCTAVSNINITITPGINVTVTPQNVSCNGANDGELNAVPTNGTGPFVYNWDLTTNIQNPTGLAPNTYSLSITDNLGCTGTAQGVITEPSVLQIDNIATTQASCGVDNGTVTISASGGTINYTYSLNGGAFQMSNVFNGLAAGNYTVQVKDNNNCIVNGNAIVSQSSLIVIDNVAVTDVSCGGLPDGSITVSVSGGQMPYSYSLNGGIAQNSNVFSNLTANTYSVEVIDNNLCSVINNNIIVNSATAMAINNITVVDATCNGVADGSFEVFVNGGDPVITYSNDGGVTFQNTPTFNGLAAANYNVQVMDGNGCIINGTTTVNEPTSLSIDNITVNNNVSCNGLSDADVTVSASGGNGVYLYSLDGGVTTTANPILSNLSANNHTVTLLEGANCSTIINGGFTITEPATISITNVAVTDVTCNGLNDGQIVITANGGTPVLTYSNDGGATFQNTPTFSNLGFGTYNIQVADNNNCPIAAQTVNIIEGSPMTITLGLPDTTVCLGSNANVCALVTGGDGNYTYSWNGVALPNNCLPILTAAAGQTTYSVIATDGNGCTTNNNIAIDKLVTVTGALQLTANTFTANICQETNGSVFSEVSAGSGNGGPYTYTWTNNIDGTILNGPNQTVSPNQNTTYTVTASDGCTVPDVSQNVSINIIVTPNYTILPNTTVNGCPPFEIDFSTTLDQNLIIAQNWDFGNGNSSTSSSSTQLFENEGCYDVSFNFTTTDGCYIDTLLSNLICVNPYPIAEFNFNPENPDLLSLDVDFMNESVGGTNYNWNFGDNTSSNDVSPSHTYPEYGAVDWLVELKVSNSFGCIDSITKTVHIKELQIYYIPNTFTPDGNGRNEVFKPIFIPGFIPLDYHFTIFDRWGNQIFRTDDIYSSWNGKIGNNFVQDGTYVWRIDFVEKETDKRHFETGHINVIR